MPSGADLTRTFAAVVPPDDVLAALAALRGRLEPSLPGLRWAKRENLHFTLRFFGDLTRGEIDDAVRAMDAIIPGARSFPLVLSGLGVFPGWKRPRVLWAGAAEGGETLAALARMLERAFRDVGLGEADKPFVPHLTLGRWRELGGAVPAAGRETAERQGALASFSVGEIVLMKSVLDPRGSIYTPLHTARLGG